MKENIALFVIVGYIVLIFIFPPAVIPLSLAIFIYGIYAAFKFFKFAVDDVSKDSSAKINENVGPPQKKAVKNQQVYKKRPRQKKTPKQSAKLKRYKNTNEPGAGDEKGDQPFGAIYNVETDFVKFGVTNLWHITHKRNLKSILKNGILNHHESHGLMPNRQDISDPLVQRWRKQKENIYGRKIHEYVPLYIQPLNPMIFRLRHLSDELVWLAVSVSVFGEGDCLFTDGNAASKQTRFFWEIGDLNKLSWDALNARFWSDFPDGKRKRCAEVLVYPKVHAKFIERIYCNNGTLIDELGDQYMNIQVNKKLFFKAD